jgi:hypothetical protein
MSSTRAVGFSMKKATISRATNANGPSHETHLEKVIVRAGAVAILRTPP